MSELRKLWRRRHELPAGALLTQTTTTEPVQLAQLGAQIEHEDHVSVLLEPVANPLQTNLPTSM